MKGPPVPLRKSPNQGLPAAPPPVPRRPANPEQQLFVTSGNHPSSSSPPPPSSSQHAAVVRPSKAVVVSAPRPGPPVPARSPGASPSPIHLSPGLANHASPSPSPPPHVAEQQQQQLQQRDLLKFPSFNVTLTALMASQARVAPAEPLPRIYATLVDMIVTNGGLKSEGIFRLSASMQEVARLRTTLDKGAFNVEFHGDPNTPACVLKQWIGELQEPLIPPSCAETMLENQGSSEQIAASAEACLPAINARLLRALLQLLRKVLQFSEQNRMTVQSLATVWSPNIFGRPKTETNPFAFVQITQLQTEWVISLETIVFFFKKKNKCGFVLLQVQKIILSRF